MLGARCFLLASGGPGRRAKAAGRGRAPSSSFLVYNQATTSRSSDRANGFHLTPTTFFSVSFFKTPIQNNLNQNHLSTMKLSSALFALVASAVAVSASASTESCSDFQQKDCVVFSQLRGCSWNSTHCTSSPPIEAPCKDAQCVDCGIAVAACAATCAISFPEGCISCLGSYPSCCRCGRYVGCVLKSIVL